MKRIAVVEDNPDNRLLLQVLLADRYIITEYVSGAEAVARIPAERPDLVLLDISLPELDGYEVLRRLRADPATAGIPVIACTAYAMAGDRAQFLAEGFDEYLTKPIVDESHLQDMISRLIGGTTR
jgi:two-component system cell cycle response regulator DivK